MRKIDSIIIHCSDSPFGNVETIDDWHKQRGWDCIGYHYVITNRHPTTTKRTQANYDGKIEVGRPIEKMGSHARGYNRNSIGVCIIGKERFTPRQLDGLMKLLCKLCIEYKIKPKNILGHFETYPDKFKDGVLLPPPKTCPNIDKEGMDNLRELVDIRIKGWKK